MSTASDLLTNYQHIIETLTFTTGSKGVFNVTVDGKVLYSKYESGRHAEPGEVLTLFTDGPGQGVERYAEN